MPRIPFRAHLDPKRGWIVRLRPPHFYDLEEAAKALSVASPVSQSTSQFGARTAQRLLHDAANAGLTGNDLVDRRRRPARARGDRAPARPRPHNSALAAAVRDRLLQLQVFPDPALGLGKDDWQPPSNLPIRARWRAGRWLVRVDGEVTYTLTEAAQALALAHTRTTRFGTNTAQTHLAIAAESGLSGPCLPVTDPEAAEWFRQELLRVGVFPPEAGYDLSGVGDPITA